MFTRPTPAPAPPPPPTHATPITTIDGVLRRLDEIIQESRRRRDRRGYFAALYRRMTGRVLVGIQRGEFEDGPRMERLDVLFAQRYFDAWDGWHRGRPVPQVWREALTPTDEPRMILQYLLVGMNAHINFDLALAARDLALPGGLLPLKRDFMKINDLLAEQLDAVQGRIGRFSPLFHAIDRAGGRHDEVVASFSIVRARQSAWDNAMQLSNTPDGPARSALEDRLDRKTADRGRLIATPGSLGGRALQMAAALELATVEDVIDALVMA